MLALNRNIFLHSSFHLLVRTKCTAKLARGNVIRAGNRIVSQDSWRKTTPLVIHVLQFVECCPILVCVCILHLHVYRHALLPLRLCMSKCTPRCVALWPAEWSGAISTFERGRGSGRPQSTSYTFPILRVGHLWRVVVRSHFRIEVEEGHGYELQHTHIFPRSQGALRGPDCSFGSD